MAEICIPMDGWLFIKGYSSLLRFVKYFITLSRCNALVKEEVKTHSRWNTIILGNLLLFYVFSTFIPELVFHHDFLVDIYLFLLIGLYPNRVELFLVISTDVNQFFPAISVDVKPCSQP